MVNLNNTTRLDHADLSIWCGFDLTVPLPYPPEIISGPGVDGSDCTRLCLKYIVHDSNNSQLNNLYRSSTRSPAIGPAVTATCSHRTPTICSKPRFQSSRSLSCTIQRHMN
jgi:hypothetical protein